LSQKDSSADMCLDKKGNPEGDPDLRDHELVPLNQNWEEYFQREVKLVVPDSWVDLSYTDTKDGKVGRVG
jgi:type I restriction enzyme M protein